MTHYTRAVASPEIARETHAGAPGSIGLCRCGAGWMLSTRESAALARELVEQTAQREAVPKDQLTLHADRGAPMRSKTLAELLVDLGIQASFSRPQQSNDNPYSESWFKTTKYAPDFPACFAGIDHAREVDRKSVVWGKSVSVRVDLGGGRIIK